MLANACLISFNTIYGSTGLVHDLSDERTEVFKDFKTSESLTAIVKYITYA